MLRQVSHHGGLNLHENFIKEVDEKRLLHELPLLLLLEGDLLLAVSPKNAAEAAGIYRAILVRAWYLRGRILVLQAATRFCKLEMLEGEAKESGRALAKIYDSFTEGFDTSDLRAARDVLDEWRE